MDLNQNKLSKTEWDSIEIPPTNEEKEIFKLITKSFDNLEYYENNSLSIFTFLKLSDNDTIHNYIYMQYLQPLLEKIFKKYNTKYEKLNLNIKSLNKSDIIRFEHMEKTLHDKKDEILEYILINYIEKILKYNEKNEVKHIKYIYTLKIILKYNLKLVNKHLLDLLNKIISYFDDELDKLLIIKNSKEIIINNSDLIKYSDKKLYQHQYDLFKKINIPTNKLIFYVAPTGTGKTLSPLGLSQKYKIIFVCAVRHVGLALAKAAISMEKCVAFAFGCNDISDIRLHYFSAKEYTRNTKTGGIFKVDNSIGDKVEIMICDIKSYLYAMRYMLAFNRKENIILYWDEPTITLDYEEHPLHDIINNNWKTNEIQNIILSSATLPKLNELTTTISDYKGKFGGEVYYINNFDCSKTVSIINREGYVEAPHYMYEEYNKSMIQYLDSNKTILKYIDLDECIEFINYINKKELYRNDNCKCDDYFTEIENITISSIKEYYLFLLKNVNIKEWKRIFVYFRKKRVKRYESTSYIVSNDAYTLVNGPTIYLSNDIQKMSHFCIQCMNFPNNIIKNISDIIKSNSEINKKIAIFEKDFDDGISKEIGKEKKMSNDKGLTPELKQIKKNIESLKQMIETVSLPGMYIPNSRDHLIKMNKSDIKNAFTSDISEVIVEKIMLINDIEDIWKLLLLMGIGVFALHSSDEYIEVMKDLAKSKKLYLIIATSDYIYGTNYQFDHCYLGKDLENMTQEKIIQAIGRVGRNKVSDEYTIRIRDNNLLYKIFEYDNNKIEVKNMEKLFNSEEEIPDLY